MKLKLFKSGHVHDVLMLRRCAFRILCALRAERFYSKNEIKSTANALLSIQSDTVGKIESELHKEFFLQEMSECLMTLALHSRVIMDRLPDTKQPFSRVIVGKLCETNESLESELNFRQAANKIIHADELRFVLTDSFNRRREGLAAISTEYSVYKSRTITFNGNKNGSNWQAEVDIPDFVSASTVLIDVGQKISAENRKLEDSMLEEIRREIELDKTDRS